MTKTLLSIYERLIQDPKRKKKLDEKYRELLLSELIIALTEEDYISARRLKERLIAFKCG